MRFKYLLTQLVIGLSMLIITVVWDNATWIAVSLLYIFATIYVAFMVSFDSDEEQDMEEKNGNQ